MKETQIKINVNFRIIPFGHTLIEIKGSEGQKEKTEKEFPVYVEPRTTHPETIEFTFGGENYGTPKTTGGFL